MYKLGLPSAELDQQPFSNIVGSISNIIKTFSPDEIFIPHLGDVHSDHEIVHNAVISSTKTFRCPFIKRLIAYETISETEYGLDRSRSFIPNLYIDISNYLDKKIDLLGIYSSEMGPFPFPRSKEAVISLARFRGSNCNCKAAEAFEILKQIE